MFHFSRTSCFCSERSEKLVRAEPMLKEKGRAGFSKWRRSAKQPGARRASSLLLHLRAVAVKTTANLEQKLGSAFRRARGTEACAGNPGNPIYIYSSQQF